MTNRFGFDLYPKEVRWAAAEGVSEDVIAAVLLLHEHSVEEIAPQLSPLELEKVIELVGRSPRLTRAESWKRSTSTKIHWRPHR
jgi:hypothetical protein